MKNLILRSALSLMVAACSFTDINAQCPAPAHVGVNNEGVQCFFQGQWGEHVWPFKNYEEFTVSSSLTVDVDSIRIDSINNLPCGISWTTSNAANGHIFDKNELGCFTFAGTTNDVLGLYNLDLIITAWFGHDPNGLQVNSRLGSLSIFAEVVTPGTQCPATIDTTQNRKTAACPTVAWTGINDLSNEVKQLSNSPNPFSTTTTISFTAGEAKNYSLKVYDVTGKMVHESTVNAKTGANNITFSRKGLDAGVYFYSLSNGKETITNKMVVGQ
jgi:hypothetical protein